MFGQVPSQIPMTGNARADAIIQTSLIVSLSIGSLWATLNNLKKTKPKAKATPKPKATTAHTRLSDATVDEHNERL